jgi:hypothetical protein
MGDGCMGIEYGNVIINTSSLHCEVLSVYCGIVLLRASPLRCEVLHVPYGIVPQIQFDSINFSWRLGANAHFSDDFFESFVQGLGGILFAGLKEVLCAKEAGEADSGQAHGTQEADGLVGIIDAAADLNNLPDKDAQHDDFILETEEFVTVQV